MNGKMLPVQKHSMGGIKDVDKRDTFPAMVQAPPAMHAMRLALEN